MTLYKTIADLNGGTQVAMSSDEESSFIAAQNASAANDISSSLKAQAREALTKSDVTVLRCVENNVALPSAWLVYRQNLRSIIDTGSGTIPSRPDYPANT